MIGHKEAWRTLLSRLCQIIQAAMCTITVVQSVWIGLVPSAIPENGWEEDVSYLIARESPPEPSSNHEDAPQSSSPPFGEVEVPREKITGFPALLKGSDAISEASDMKSRLIYKPTFCD